MAAVFVSLRGGGFALDTDSAMRLVQIRDLLAGQSWWDTTQYRMDVPFGLSTHWSRLGDLGPALLLIAMHPLGAARAETVMLYVWPLLLFLPVLLALSRIAAHMGGRAAGVIVLPLTMLAVALYGLFGPGAIDHHNLQLALMAWMLVFLIEHRPVGAAVTIGLSLCIGLETLPYAALAILLACFWMLEREEKTRRFGLTLALLSPLLLFGIAAQRYWFTPACDTYSLFYAMLLGAGGLGLAVVTMLPRQRMLATIALAAAVVGLAAWISRDCLMGPYAGVSPMLRAIFLSRINEARPALDYVSFAPSEFVMGYAYAVFALLAGLFLPRNRAVWLGLLFVCAALGMATLEIRETPFALLMALPGLAAVLAVYVLPRGLLMMVVAILLSSDAAFALTGAALEGDDAQATRIHAFNAQAGCGEAPAMAPLLGLPPGRVAGFVDQGPAILAYTQDSAIAGPYHRDSDGILDTYAVFTGPPDAAHAILKKRGIHYLMACSAAPDWHFYQDRAPQGLLAQLAAGELPAWLTPAGQSGAVTVWRVK